MHMHNIEKQVLNQPITIPQYEAAFPCSILLYSNLKPAKIDAKSAITSSYTNYRIYESEAVKVRKERLESGNPDP